MARGGEPGVWAALDLSALPIPRVWAFLSPDPEGADRMCFGFELSGRYSEPVFGCGFEFDWRRGRPWELEFEFPRKYDTRERRLRWTRPS